MYLVRGGSIDGFDSLVRGLSQNPVEQLQKVGLTLAQFRNPNTFISLAKMAELIERCQQACEEPLFGLILAQQQQFVIFSDLWASSAQEPTVLETLKRFNELLPLHVNGAQMKIAVKKRSAEIHISFRCESELGVYQLLQVATGQVAKSFASMVGMDCYDLKLHLRQMDPTPKNVSNCRFYPQVQFNSEFDGIEFPIGLLKQKPRLDEQEVRRHFQDYLSLLERNYPNSLSDKVRDIIGRLLPSGECSFNNVASSLSMSRRTLQRRLQELDTSYESLLKETRQSIATQHLEHGSLSMTELALNLGYAEGSVLSRNFKSWTGLTPLQWRKRHSSIEH